jgi:deoxyribodipyrimidine photolyase-like uncharacterized protein
VRTNEADHLHPFDHLHRKFGALKDADPKTDVIAFVESARMTTGRNWHTERLFFLISSARHFAQSLEDEGFTVEYIKAATTVDGLKQFRRSTRTYQSPALNHLLFDSTTSSKPLVSALYLMISS